MACVSVIIPKLLGSKSKLVLLCRSASVDKKCRVDEVLERAGKEVIKHGDCSAVNAARCPSYTCSRTMTEVTAYQRRANVAFCQEESEEQTLFPTSVAAWLSFVMQRTHSEANSIARLMVMN